MRYILLTCMIAGCGSATDTMQRMQFARDTGVSQLLPDPRRGGIDAELRQHVATFEAHWGQSIGNITVSFGNTGPGLYAYCGTVYTGEREIVVDSNRWHTLVSAAGPEYGEMIIMHELGHCALMREHLNTVDEFGRKQSVMHYQGAESYGQFREEYIHELFNY